MKNKTDYAIVITLIAVIIACAVIGLTNYEAFGANDTATTIEVTGAPNTVVILCENDYNKDYVDCTRTNVWYQDYEIIKEETFSYQISAEDYRNGDL